MSDRGLSYYFKTEEEREAIRREELRIQRMKQRAQINAEAIGLELEYQRELDVKQRQQEEEERREYEEKAERDRREFEEALAEEQRYYAEQLEEERQAHEEEMFEKKEAARKLAEREAVSLCYNHKGEKILGIYDGELKNGLPTGYGILHCDDGDRYEGEFALGRFNGYGKSIRENGDIRYEGDYKAGLFNNQGTYYYLSMDKQGRKYYKGGFVNGKRAGKGELVWNNGTVYIGNFVDNEMSGSGIMKWPNGDVYEGEFKAGKRNGIGKYTSATGSMYKGSWLDGKRCGKGVITHPNGESFDCLWQNDVAVTGKIKLFSSQSCVYHGEIRDGKKDGFGISYFEDGSIQYEGEWKNNLWWGKGKEYDRNGKLVKEGSFVSGELHGEQCNLYHYVGSELAYSQHGRFEKNTFKYGTCKEGEYTAVGSFDPTTNRVKNAKIFKNNQLIIEGNINNDSIIVHYEDTAYSCVRCYRYSSSTFIGENNDSCVRLSIFSGVLSDKRDKCIGIGSLYIYKGEVVNDLYTFLSSEKIIAFVKDGSAYYEINKHTNVGKLYFDASTSNYANYCLPVNDGAHMLLEGQFVDYIPNGECVITDHHDSYRWKWKETAYFRNGIRNGKFIWRKKDKEDKNAEQQISGEYIDGRLVDVAKIKYVNDAIVEEYAGHIDQFGEPNGLGVMKFIHYDDSTNSATYGIWNGIGCEQEMSYLSYKLKSILDKPNLL